MQAIREDEILTESLGINITARKLTCFFISSFFAGVSGSLYAYYTLVLDPSVAHPSVTVLIIAMVIIGGLGTIKGAFIGGLGLVALSESMRAFGVVYNLIAVGLAVMITLVLFPKGIMGFLEKYIK